MAYVRGHRGDFDRWAGRPDRLVLRDALPYFRKQESWEGGDNAYRGGDGPLGTDCVHFQDPLVDAFADGRPGGRPCRWTDDYNGPSRKGFGRLQMTIRNGRRAARRWPICARRWAAQSHHRNRCAGHSRRLRGRSRHRRRIPPGRRDQDGARARTRGDPLAGGAINSPQTPDAVGHRRARHSSRTTSRSRLRSLASARTCTTTSR